LQTLQSNIEQEEQDKNTQGEERAKALTQVRLDLITSKIAVRYELF